MMFVSGRMVQTLLMLISISAIYYYVQQAKKGKEITLRALPALEAVDEAVGRAAELGRPVHFSAGRGSLYTTKGPAVMAGFVVLQKVAELCAKLGTYLIVSLNQPEGVPIVEDTLSTVYTAQNSVSPYSVRFISTEQYAYASGVLSILREEKPGANILVGSFSSESLQFAEGGKYIGAMQIGGTDNVGQIPFFITSCDYCLIGEEVYAARAYIDGGPINLGSILGQDIMRLSYIALIFITWISANIGLSQIINMIKM